MPVVDSPLNLNSNKITNLAPGVNPTDAATVSQITTGGGVGTGVVANLGAIQPSTAYSPGDIIEYQGQHVLITQAVTSTDWPNWFTTPQLTGGTFVPIDPQTIIYASDFGVIADSGGTDNTQALTKALWYAYEANNGGIVFLPPGNIGTWIQVSNTIIIPSGVTLVGQGIENTMIKLAPNSNCDIVQFATFGSDTQAAILTTYLGTAAPGAFSIRNAFYSGLMNLCLNGHGAVQSASDYSMGVNAITNPVSEAAGTDPNFDPTNFLFNIEVTQCTGDGYNQANSRGQMRVTNCLFRGNSGWGTVSGTDTIYVGCNFAQNGLGGFLDFHGSASGSAAKVFNNGEAIAGLWVSGTAYSANDRVVFNNALYGALNDVTSSTSPDTDTTNWVAITGATDPQFYGCGMVFTGSTAQECTWSSVGFQENSGSDLYLQGAIGVRVTGNSQAPNWSVANSAQSTTNTLNQAVVVLDDAVGNIVELTSVNAGTAPLLRVINGSTQNDVTFTGDSLWTSVLTPDSTSLIESGNRVSVNGTFVSTVTVAVDGFAVVASTDGTPTSSGAIVLNPHDEWLGIYDPSAPLYYGISKSLPSPGGTSTLGGYFNGLGVGGTSANSSQPIFGVLNSTQSGTGIGHTALTVLDNNTVETFNSTLDDGSGNATLAGTLNMSGKKITNGAPGVAGTDFATVSQISGSGMTNPMTTLGDIIVENSTPAAARLAGNTTTTKKFLTQTGNGTISSLPGWNTIVAGDIPTLNQSTTGTAAGLSATLAIASGGTNATTAAAALTSLGAAAKAGTTFTGFIAPAVVALTDGSSVALNAALGNVFTWSLGAASHTLAVPTNPVNGQVITIDISYSGAFTPLFNAIFAFGADGQPTWTSVSGKMDTVAFRFSTIKTAWLCQGWKLGY